MSGILRLENLNTGTTLKQGDKTVLSYRLSDADGDNLNIAGNTAVARLMHPDFTRIGYESEALTVSADNIVQFSIDSIIPSRLYYLEITVDGQYIFPSRSDEGKLSIDRSSMGAEITIIENAGIDAVVRKAVDLINEDPSLIIDEERLVNEIIANTSVGSIEEYYQEYRDAIQEYADLKPKALSAISKSDEALTRSQNALNVANGIDAKATNALNLSESADTLSKSVRDNFNQIITGITDKDIVSAPEIVGARGGHDTLGQRLDETTAQLAQIVQDASITVTVGTGGDYSTINEALGFLSKKRLKYDASGFKAVIKLLSGFIMAEQVIIEGLDLGWVQIDSVDDIVEVDKANLTNTITIPKYSPASAINVTPMFGGNNNATLPIINVLFNMGEDGGARTAFFVGNNSKLTILPGAGCTNSGAQGIYAVQGALVAAAGAVLTNAKANAVSCFRGAIVNFRGGDGSGAGGYGIYLDNNAFADCSDANFSNASLSAVLADGNSIVSCNSSNLSNSGGGISASNGSIVDAHNSVINNSGGRGVSCNGATVIVKDSTMSNATMHGIFCRSNGNVDAENAIIEESGSYTVYALSGGRVNAKSVKGQMVIGTNKDDFRVAQGGYIVANDALGGVYGGVINKINTNGVVFASNSSATMEYTARLIWTFQDGNGVTTGMFPLDNANTKTFILTRINVFYGSNLTPEELALITVEKHLSGISLTVTDSALATKLSQKSVKIWMTVTG